MHKNTNYYDGINKVHCNNNKYSNGKTPVKYTCLHHYMQISELHKMSEDFIEPKIKKFNKQVQRFVYPTYILILADEN